MSHPMVDVASVAEWACAAMALRACHGRAQEDTPSVRELRISVTPNALPGLAVIEFEFVDANGMCVAGGQL